MSLYKIKTPIYPGFHTIMLIYLTHALNSHYSVAAPVPNFEDNLVTYSNSPSEVLPIEPLLIYPEAREMLYQARTLGGDGERDIIFVKLLQGKSDGYHPKQQRLVEKENRRKEVNFKDIFYVKARANGQFSHERLKVYRLPEFYAISVFRNGEK